MLGTAHCSQNFSHFKFRLWVQLVQIRVYSRNTLPYQPENLVFSKEHLLLFFCTSLLIYKLWRRSMLSYPRSRSRILGRNWDKICYSQSPLLRILPPPPRPGTKLVLNWFFNINIVYGNIKSKNSQDYAQIPQRNCMFMNSPEDSFSLLWSRFSGSGSKISFLWFQDSWFRGYCWYSII